MTQTNHCSAARATPLARTPSFEARAFIERDEVPDQLLCPITLAPMHDPVSLDGHGQVFERSALLRHFASRRSFKNPATNEAMAGTPACTPRLDLRQKYDDFRAAVQALDPAKAQDLPSGPRQSAGRLVADNDAFERGTWGAPLHVSHPTAAPGTPTQGQAVHRTYHLHGAPAVCCAGAGCAACVLGCGAALVVVPVACVLGIALSPVNCLLSCLGLPQLPIRASCFTHTDTQA